VSPRATENSGGDAAWKGARGCIRALIVAIFVTCGLPSQDNLNRGVTGPNRGGSGAMDVAKK